jgi:pectinesterase
MEGTLHPIKEGCCSPFSQSAKCFTFASSSCRYIMNNPIQSDFIQNNTLLLLVINMFLVFAFLSLFALAKCSSSNDVELIVRSDGSGQFTSIQAALDSLNPGNQTGNKLGHVTVNILGYFFERVNCYSNFTGGVTILGAGATPMDSFINYNVSGAIVGTFNSWTFIVSCANFTLINVAVANSANDYQKRVAGQSVALHLNNDFNVIQSSALLGAQDTLFTGAYRSFFQNTFINGSCDSLFGYGSSVFDGCTITVYDTITAAKNNGTTAYLIQNSVVDPAQDPEQAPGTPSSVLGRPWGLLAKTVFKSNYLGELMNGQGWNDWNHNCTSGHSPVCDTVFYAEFNSTGPGAAPDRIAQRVWWSHQLNETEAAKWTTTSVLNGWDGSSMAISSSPTLQKFIESLPKFWRP